MKKFIAFVMAAAFVATASPVAHASDIVREDAKTNVTQRFINGQLEERFEELGTWKIDNSYLAARRKLQEGGVRLHCARLLRAKNRPANLKCGGAVNVRNVSQF